MAFGLFLAQEHFVMRLDKSSVSHPAVEIAFGRCRCFASTTTVLCVLVLGVILVYGWVEVQRVKSIEISECEKTELGLRRSGNFW